MINFENCQLYNLKRKRDLYYLIRSTPKEVGLILNKYKVCISEEKRLLEKPSFKLKLLQKSILNKLYQIQFPEYVFSGIKGRSAYDNAITHLNSKCMLKLDMSKFFPNTHRDKVYNFFHKNLRMSVDVAKLCTDITTINYNAENVSIDDNVFDYMKSKHIKIRNHLPSGTPTSQILSYLANLDMFDEIVAYCKCHKLICSLYVDDITLSTNRKISFKEEKQLKGIVKKYGQKISKNKTIRYSNSDYKKITGFVISPEHKLVVGNKTRLKIKTKLAQVKNIKEIDNSLKNSLVGLANFSELSVKNSYQGLKKQLKKSVNMQK